jgi:hypothetical protein
MTDPTQAFTKNQFVDKMMSWIPQDPLTQSAYMYSLTTIVFLGLLGYAGASWWTLFANPFQAKVLFSSLFMTAIAMISVVGVKQTRDSYHMIKMMYANQQPEIKLESKEEMEKGFNEKKA